MVHERPDAFARPMRVEQNARVVEPGPPRAAGIAFAPSQPSCEAQAPIQTSTTSKRWTDGSGGRKPRAAETTRSTTGWRRSSANLFQSASDSQTSVYRNPLVVRWTR